MKSLTDYTIIVRPDDNNTFVAYVPAIKGCHAWGKSEEEARLELNNVFSIPIHGNAEIGGWLFKEILSQLGITEEEFNQLK